jgi:hypothetical protein
MQSRPKALGIPRIRHLGWKLPWLQIAERKHQDDRRRQRQAERMTQLDGIYNVEILNQHVNRTLHDYGIQVMIA